jgi:hypothetical protein
MVNALQIFFVDASVAELEDSLPIYKNLLAANVGNERHTEDNINSPIVSGRKHAPNEALANVGVPVEVNFTVILSPGATSIACPALVSDPVVFVSDMVTTRDVSPPFFLTVKVTVSPTPGAICRLI